MQEKVVKLVTPKRPGAVDMREVESYRQLFGRKQYTAGGFEFRSTWWKHPTRNADGSLRAKEVTYARYASPTTRQLFCKNVHDSQCLMSWMHPQDAAALGRYGYG